MPILKPTKTFRIFTYKEFCKKFNFQYNNEESEELDSLTKTLIEDALESLPNNFILTSIFVKADQKFHYFIKEYPSL